MEHFYETVAIWGRNEVDVGAARTERGNFVLGGRERTLFDPENNGSILILTHLFQIQERTNWTKRRRLEKEGEIFFQGAYVSED